MRATPSSRRSLGAALLAALSVPLLLPCAASAAPATHAAAPSEDYLSRVQPLFDKRCIACHSCYNSPCQLNLTAFEGLDRGATKALLYEPQRVHHAPTMRLFEDAKSTQEWQSRMGFFPVVRKGSDAGLSLMVQLLAHKANHPNATGVFHAEESHACPKDQKELDTYLGKKPEGGMPLGFPALSDAESGVLFYWLKQGAPGPSAATLARLQRPSNGAAGEAILAKWEAFLNGQDAKMRLSARYIFEHLFLAHLRFDGIPGDNFRLVRSRTPTGQAVDEIPTRRPYDDPGAKFYYRFRRISGTIVRKTHMPYLLNDARLARYRQLFLDAQWARSAPPFPSYSVEVASNPFVSFADIPAKSRSQFLLDDAYYHVMTFIRGPVCKGHTALNVIDAHFYIMFLQPEADPTVTHAEFLPSVSKYLKLPAQGEDGIKALYARYKYDQLEYLKLRQKLYQKYAAQGRTLNDIWDGGGSNDSAILTVYRHDESADVIKGAHGGTPKTVWVMDYPIFERVYYDLVAGFDVFGNLVHQLSTRAYMDNLRVESEDEFLTFLPAAQRKPLRKTWYRGVVAEAVMALLDPLYEQHIETRIKYRDPAHSKEEFLAQVLRTRLNPKVRGPLDVINNKDPALVAAGAASLGEPNQLARITKKQGDFTQPFPEVNLVRVRGADGKASVYTLLHNRAFKNVRFIFAGDVYREPASDELHVLRGFQGSYPNFFWDVPREKLNDFLNAALAVRSKDASFKKLVDTYGIRRMDPRFWAMFDWLNARYRQESPVEAGILDLSRYENL